VGGTRRGKAGKKALRRHGVEEEWWVTELPGGRKDSGSKSRNRHPDCAVNRAYEKERGMGTTYRSLADRQGKGGRGPEGLRKTASCGRRRFQVRGKLKRCPNFHFLNGNEGVDI